MAGIQSTCLACGNGFARAPRGRPRKYCTDCRPATKPASKLSACAGCRGTVWKSKSAADPSYCRECRSARHGSLAMYRGGCRCNECRARKSASNSRYAANRAASGLPVSAGKARLDRECEQCGEAFSARVDSVKDGHGRFCGIRCANVARNLARGFSRRRGPKSEFRKRAERLARKSARGTTGGGLVWVQGACIVCTEQFMSPGLASRYCSLSCRELNRRNTSYGLTWLDRMALFARDDWSCQICSEPVDYSADPLSDWYPTIDHIVPRSKGGGDELENLRCAHRWCNSVRGDLSWYTDVDLAA